MFKVTVYLPHSERYVSVRQFNNFEYKTLLKTLLNKNYNECNNYIDKLMQSCVDQAIDNINIIDKLALILNLRCISIGDTLVQTIKQETSTARMNYSIYSIIQKIADHKYPSFDNLTILEKNITLKLTLPKYLFFDIKDISSFIDTITIKNESFKVERLSKSKRVEMIDILPGGMLPVLYKHIRDLQLNLNSLELMQLRTEIDKKEAASITLQLDQINMYTLINAFFNEHISNLFLKQFILSKHYNIDCDYFDKMSPVESEIFFSFHKEIQEEEEKRVKSSNNTGPSIPGAIADSI